MKNWFRDVAGQKFDPKDLLGKKKGYRRSNQGSCWLVRKKYNANIQFSP